MLLNSIGDKLELGAITAAIGLFVVFSMLLFIILCVFVMAKGVKAITAKKNKIAQTLPTVQADISTSDVVVKNNQEAIVAAITGAIAVIFASEIQISPNKAKAKFIVKSIKRI